MVTRRHLSLNGPRSDGRSESEALKVKFLLTGRPAESQSHCGPCSESSLTVGLGLSLAGGPRGRALPHVTPGALARAQLKAKYSGRGRLRDGASPSPTKKGAK